MGGSFIRKTALSKFALEDKFITKTASYTVTLNDLFKHFTNQGATGAVVLTLPDLSSLGNSWDGVWIEATNTEAPQSLAITAASGQLMVQGTGTASTTMTTTTIGSWITLKWHSASGNWLCRNSGNWTAS